MSKFKIVHIITRFILGGADENTLITCNIQAENGHEVHLMVGYEWSSEMRERLHPKVKFVVVQNMKREITFFKDVKSYFYILAYLRQVCPNIVHTHESKAGILGRFTAPFLRAKSKYVHGVHIIPFMNVSSRFQFQLYFWLEKAASYLTDSFISVSPALEKTMLDTKIAKKKNSFVVFSGMPLKTFRDKNIIDDSEIAKFLQGGRKPSEISNSFKIIMTGTLEKRKRVELGIKAVKELTDRGIDVTLIVCGGGAEEKMLKRLASGIGVGDRILFIGYTSKISQFIQKSDLGLHCSNHEGLPRVIVQYIAAGKPVLSTDLPGVDQIVKHNSNGFLLTSSDLVTEIADRVQELHSDNKRYKCFCRASNRTDLTLWDEEIMVSRIEKIYRELN